MMITIRIHKTNLKDPLIEDARRDLQADGCITAVAEGPRPADAHPHLRTFPQHP